MYSYAPIGDDAVQDDKGLFASYWERVKHFIPDLLALPAKIRGLRQEALGYQIVAKQKKMMEHASTLQSSATKLSGMASLADSIKTKIQKYLPFWQKQGSGLGIPLLIPIVAISALAVVAVQGMSLLKDYEFQRSIVNDVKNKVLSLAEAQALIKGGLIPKKKTLGEGLGDAATTIGLAVAGVLGFVLWQRFGKKSV